MSRHNFVLQRQTLYDRQLSAMPMHGAAWPGPKNLENLSVELVTWVVT